MDSLLARLRQVIADHYSSEDLRALCVDLGVDYDGLAGSTVGAKTQALLRESARQRQLERLIDLLDQSRAGFVTESDLPTGPTIFAAMYDESVALEAELNAYVAQATAAHRDWANRLFYRSAGVPRSPYPFLYPFEYEDAGIFFGRDSAVKLLYEAILKDRLTLFHGKSAVGKSSLLKAGLCRQLLRKKRLPVYVRAGIDPVSAIKCALTSRATGAWPEMLSTISLHEFLDLTCSSMSHDMQELVILLDQFEEYLVFWPEWEQRQAFIDALKACYEDSSIPVRFVIALRSIAYTELYDFQERIPSLFSNAYRLNPMTRQEAQAAITKPVAGFSPPVTYENALVEVLLDDLDQGGPVLLRSLWLGGVEPRSVLGVQPLHIQIICTRLYAGLEQDESVITRADYENLGGARNLLDNYLYHILDQLSDREAAIAREILKALVSSHGTSRILSATALQVRVQATQEILVDVLSWLARARLLRERDCSGELHYELAHDCLIDELKTWFEPSELALKQAEDLLMRAVAGYSNRIGNVPRDYLAQLYRHRERFHCLHEKAWIHLLRVVLQDRFFGEDWTKLVGDVSEELLLASLTDARQEIRRAALRRLGDIWELPDAYKLADEDPHVRETAARALGELGDPRTVQPLIATLQHEEIGLRQSAAEGLGKIADARAVEPLIVALQDHESGVRWRAAESLGKIGDPRAVGPLIAALRDADSAVRWSVVWALCEIGKPAVEPLISALHDTDRVVRQSAARSLGKIGDSRAVEPLIATLKDQDSTMRRLAAWALHQIGDPRAVQPLIAALRDEDKDVRWSALEALVNIRVP